MFISLLQSNQATQRHRLLTWQADGEAAALFCVCGKQAEFDCSRCGTGGSSHKWKGEEVAGGRGGTNGYIGW